MVFKWNKRQHVSTEIFVFNNSSITPLWRDITKKYFSLATSVRINKITHTRGSQPCIVDFFPLAAIHEFYDNPSTTHNTQVIRWAMLIHSAEKDQIAEGGKTETERAFLRLWHFSSLQYCNDPICSTCPCFWQGKDSIPKAKMIKKPHENGKVQPKFIVERQ